MNTILNTLKNIINQLIPNKPVEKDTKIQLKQIVTQLKNDNTIEIDSDIINVLAEMIGKERLSKQNKESIKQHLILLIEKLDVNNKLVDKTTLDILEKELDDQIDSYNKYTKNSPMLGINWNATRKKWRLQHKEIDIYNKDLNVLVEIMLKNMCPKKNGKNLNIRTTNFFVYKEKKILIYNTMEFPLFDIRHIIKLLGLKNEDYKYNDYQDKITHYGFKKNEFGGYFIKYFIPESAMYEIVLSSHKEFSKSFKTDVAEILCELRKNNQLAIKNDKLVVTKPKYTKQNICNTDVKQKLDLVLNSDTNERSYANPYYSNMIKVLINNGSNILLQKYAKQHVLYFFIITINDIDDKNRIFCKIGYSSDIIGRIKTLQDEYNCKIYLIGLKIIKNEQVEQEFHKAIKMTKKHLVYPLQLNGKDKGEVYIFDEQLYKEFEAVEENKIDANNFYIIDKYIEQYVKNQLCYFMNYLNDVNSNYYIKNFSQHNNHYKDMITMSDMNLIEKDKELQIKLKSMEYAFLLESKDKDIILKDKEIRLKELELEILMRSNKN